MSQSRTPILIKGAIIQFKKMPVVPTYNVISFQYNPESFTRSLTPYTAPQSQTTTTPPAANPVSVYSQPQEPTESFTLSLMLDASDELAAPETHPLEFVSGVAGRMAALEMLLYARSDFFRQDLVTPVSTSIGAAKPTPSSSYVERVEVPVILFVWGPGRILPVRLQTLTIEEQQWNQLLYPTRAKVSVGMKVVTKDELDADMTTDSDGKKIASFCYQWTRGQKDALAVASVTNAEGLLDFLPF